MFIERLLIENLRNLQSCALDELSLINFFVGPNGAGKTSLLEAISIASFGRSFRHHKIQTVINQQASDLSVFVQCVDDSKGLHKIGISRDKKNGYNIRINGANASSLAELSYILPVLVLDASAFLLLDGSATQRRQFIDWGVFHVEHAFYQHWRLLQRILKQRNSLLRARVTDYDSYRHWDNELVKHSVAIEGHRLAFLKLFQIELSSVLEALDSDLTAHKIAYKNGWGMHKLDFNDIESAELATEAELLVAMKASFAKDCQFQRTHLGPQKADLQLRINQHDVRDIYSRGQKKTVVAAMKLAQAKVVSRETAQRPILLLDDLPSELDDRHLQAFMQHVIAENYQCFITAVDDHQFNEIGLENSHMFHVERGKISPMIAQGEAQE